MPPTQDEDTNSEEDLTRSDDTSQMLFEKLLWKAQERSRHLDSLQLTTISVGALILTFVASTLMPTKHGLDGDTLLTTLSFAGVVLLVASAPLVLIMRSFVVPKPGFESKSFESSCNRTLVEYCLDNARRRNYVKRLFLAATWLFLVSLVYATALRGILDSDHWLQRCLLVFVASIAAVVWAYAYFLAFRPSPDLDNNTQVCLLRRGWLIDLDGYRPRSCGIDEEA